MNSSLFFSKKLKLELSEREDVVNKLIGLLPYNAAGTLFLFFPFFFHQPQYGHNKLGPYSSFWGGDNLAIHLMIIKLIFSFLFCTGVSNVSGILLGDFPDTNKCNIYYWFFPGFIFPDDVISCTTAFFFRRLTCASSVFARRNHTNTQKAHTTHTHTQPLSHHHTHLFCKTNW